jgi:hypothetical protein
MTFRQLGYSAGIKFALLNSHYTIATQLTLNVSSYTFSYSTSIEVPCNSPYCCSDGRRLTPPTFPSQINGKHTVKISIYGEKNKINGKDVVNK